MHSQPSGKGRRGPHSGLAALWFLQVEDRGRSGQRAIGEGFRSSFLESSWFVG